MPNVIYSLDSAINSFFSDAGASSSKVQCDQFAHRRYGGHIQPADIQGSTSYTVIAGPSGNKILQFREQSALLDMNMLALVKDIHGDVVPSCSKLGRIGEPQSSQLVIYEMNRLPGENFIIARPSLSCSQLLSTVNNLARFVNATLTSCRHISLLTWYEGFLCNHGRLAHQERHPWLTSLPSRPNATPDSNT